MFILFASLLICLIFNTSVVSRSRHGAQQMLAAAGWHAGPVTGTAQCCVCVWTRPFAEISMTGDACGDLPFFTLYQMQSRCFKQEVHGSCSALCISPQWHFSYLSDTFLYTGFVLGSCKIVREQLYANISPFLLVHFVRSQSTSFMYGSHAHIYSKDDTSTPVLGQVGAEAVAATLI